MKKKFVLLLAGPAPAQVPLLHCATYKKESAASAKNTQDITTYTIFEKDRYGNPLLLQDPEQRRPQATGDTL